MAASLLKIEFSEDLLPFVTDFDCRENRDRPAEIWEEEVNAWIRADPATCEGALYRMSKRGGKCKVWLYATEKEERERYDIVGYGSLARSKWPDPDQGPDIP